MNVFHSYARYYDALYGDKDYTGECRFIREILERHSSRPVKSVLDLGCGTGSHALILADMGYEVTGVDVSPDMLQIARQRAASADKRISYVRQDIRQMDLARKFDAAIAMFAVMGYQTTNEDFENTLLSVRRHLDPGSLFVFDVWFGPAVLAHKPEERVKTIDSERKIVRYASPVLDVINQTVQVNYRVCEMDGNRVIRDERESHVMRFFFHQEISYFLEKTGFLTAQIAPFLEPGKPVDEHCWNISVISRAAD